MCKGIIVTAGCLMSHAEDKGGSVIKACLACFTLYSHLPVVLAATSVYSYWQGEEPGFTSSSAPVIPKEDEEK